MLQSRNGCGHRPVLLLLGHLIFIDSPLHGINKPTDGGRGSVPDDGKGEIMKRLFVIPILLALAVVLAGCGRLAPQRRDVTTLEDQVAVLEELLINDEATIAKLEERVVYLEDEVAYLTELTGAHTEFVHAQTEMNEVLGSGIADLFGIVVSLAEVDDGLLGAIEIAEEMIRIIIDVLDG